MNLESLVGTVTGAVGATLQGALPESVRDLARRAKNTAQLASMMGVYAIREDIKGKLIPNDVARRMHFTNATSHDARIALKRLGFTIDVFGYDEKLMAENNYLMVGNHMSYMDIIVESSITPLVFVTSIDMGQVPLLGRLAALGGSVFIERRHRGQVDQDLRALTKVLQEGFNVVIYPEGTSTNGEKLLPFKKSLLMSAVEAGRDIMPICLKYTEINGEPVGPHNRDRICWYGDMTFAPHFMQLMAVKSVKAEVHFLEPIKVTKESTRQELAEKAYKAVHKCYFGFEPDHMPADTSRAKA